MCGSMVDIQSAAAEIRQGKKTEEKETTWQKYNGLPYYTGRPQKVREVWTCVFFRCASGQNKQTDIYRHAHHTT